MALELISRRQPEENRTLRIPADRMRFLALHLHDMQTLRWLPAMLGAIIIPVLPHQDFPAALGTFLCFPLANIPWSVWFRAHIRNRFGESHLTTQQRFTNIYANNWLTSTLAIVWTCMALWMLYERAALHLTPAPLAGVVGGLQMVLIYGAFAMDRTNLLERRAVKAATAIAFLALVFVFQYFTDPVLQGHVHATRSRVIPVESIAIGLVLLSNALYDYTLLHRCAHAARLEVVHG